MRRTACLVGNSSSGIREGAFIGTPVVNIGSRQAGRERGPNVVDVPNDRDAIGEALERQIANGRYATDPIYGDGNAGERIADILATRRCRRAEADHVLGGRGAVGLIPARGGSKGIPRKNLCCAGASRCSHGRRDAARARECSTA